MAFVLDPAELPSRHPEWTNWTTLKTKKVEDPRMSSTPVMSHPTPRNATSGDHLNGAELSVSTGLSAIVKHAEELDLNETDINELFKKEKRKAHMRIRTT